MLISVDFESFFNKDFNLKKMPMAAYIRDPKFRVLGAGIKINNNSPQFLRDNALRSFINNLDGTEELLCHNTAFDGLILSYWYDYIPRFYYDTLSMTRPLLGHTTSLDLNSLAIYLFGKAKEIDILDLEGVFSPTEKELEKIKIRALDDTEFVYKVFQSLLPQFPEEELQVIDTTIRMYTDPRIVLDRERTKRIFDEEVLHREELLDKLGITPTDVRSSARFAALLQAAGLEAVPTKPSPTHPEKRIYAFARTDSSFQALKQHSSEEVRDLVEARLAVKANQLEKRAEKLLYVTENSSGYLSIPLKYCGAHTFRWSGFDEINPQNLGRGSPLRSCLMARDGYYLDIKDYAQIEARIVAWLAGQDDLVAAFADPERDPYSEFATELFKFEVTKKTAPKHRFIGKTIILGSGYVMGWKKLIESIKNLSIVELGEEMVVQPHEAMQYINFYRKRYPKISSRQGGKGLWGKMHLALEHMCIGHGSFEIGPLVFERGKVHIPNGLSLVYKDIAGYGNPEFGPMRDFSYKSKDFNDTRIDIYDGKLTENVTSCLARVITTQGMNRVKPRYPALLQVHDEVLFEIPRNNAQEASDWITEQLVQEPTWAVGLPLSVEGGYSERYNK